MTALIEKINPWAALAAAFGIFSGYIVGQTTIESRVSALEAIARQNNDRLDGRERFMACTVRSLDQLQAQHDVTPPCQMEIEP